MADSNHPGVMVIVTESKQDLGAAPYIDGVQSLWPFLTLK